MANLLIEQISSADLKEIISEIVRNEVQKLIPREPRSISKILSMPSLFDNRLLIDKRKLQLAELI